MKNQMTDYLEKTTGKPWRKTDRLYLQFKTRAGVFPQFCVFTPDDYPRQPKAMCQFYLPEGDPKVWHQPRRFLNEYLNGKQQLVKQMPWIEIDLNFFPEIRSFQVYPAQDGFLILNYSLQLKGIAKLKKIDSLNHISLGINSFHNIASRAKIALSEYLDNFRVNFNEETLALSVADESKTNLGTVKIEIESSGSFSAECVPKHFSKDIIFHGWVISAETGFKISGKLERTNNLPPTKKIAPHYLLKDAGITAGALLGYSALVIFTDGAAAPFILGGIAAEIS